MSHVKNVLCVAEDGVAMRHTLGTKNHSSSCVWYQKEFSRVRDIVVEAPTSSKMIFIYSKLFTYRYLYILSVFGKRARLL